MTFQKEEFLKELLSLCEKHKIAITSDTKLVKLDDSYIQSSLSYDIVDEIQSYGGTDRCGPFLKTSYEFIKQEVEVKKLDVGLTIGDPHRLGGNKKIPSEFKELINIVKKSNKHSTMQGF